MVVGEIANSTDVLVIGGGPGGYVAALRAAQLGREVILVERDRIGGTCLNIGCIPSKVFIHAADLANLPEQTANTGVTMTSSVNLGELQDHMQSVVGGLTAGVDQLLANAGVQLLSGTARFTKPNRVAVADDLGVSHLEFSDVILATGSRPIELDSLPFSDERILDSTGALFELEKVPESLAIVGGGYIGVELGTAWAKLGAQVTIIEAESSLLPALDARLGRAVERRLAELDVTVRLDSRAEELKDNGLVITTDRRSSTVPAEYVIVCVGRRPNTDDLGLEATDVTPDATGLVSVDATRRAGRHILAIGDITAGPALAHKATAEAEVAAQTAAGIAAHFDPAAIPAIVFSDPEVATVGATVADAKLMGIDAESFSFPLRASGRARTLDARLGHVELVADESGTVIGAHMAGPNVAEVIGEVTLAIEMAATVEEITATIHAHPTIAEGIAEAAFGLAGMPLHAAGRQRQGL